MRKLQQNFQKQFHSMFNRMLKVLRDLRFKVHIIIQFKTKILGTELSIRAVSPTRQCVKKKKKNSVCNFFTQSPKRSVPDCFVLICYKIDMLI